MRALPLLIVTVLSLEQPAAASELFKLAVPQRGLWDTSIAELGQRSGIFQRYGIELEILYTQGGPEAQQAVISGSMQLLCGGGIEAIIGAYSRGAPLRIIASEMIGSPDTYWYVLADSPIRKDDQLFAERLVQPCRGAGAARPIQCGRQAGDNRRPPGDADHDNERPD
jgi:NitT/TauT family transport system substrate-binding protein